uniref:hypothetical protein n=1 Tax=Ningiella ruwaisensis TaxID=2364274 RepID=UPI0015D32020|nr:hypothetical protein [Ningiella ruwaisensis]
MKNIKLLCAALMMTGSSLAFADAIITDGNVSLGVDDLGQLNVGGGVADVTGITSVGMRFIDSSGNQYESTSHGCECEGWGVGIAETGESGYANNSSGTAGLTAVNFVSDATTATAVTSTASLQITHDFALSSETDNLFEVVVTIENTSATDIANLLYRRTFDWDTSPTPFNEFVSIQGADASTNITGAGNNGFCSSNVFSGCAVTGDILASGPGDIGANFDFDFGALAAGEAFSFSIFYGGALGRDAALAALGEVGAEAYSFGWSGSDADQDGFLDGTTDLAPTYIFAFAGVGGTVIVDPTPDPVSAPATLGLFSAVLLGLFGARRKLS